MECSTVYLLLCNSSCGNGALIPCPCCVHIRPILVVGVVGTFTVEVDGFFIVADGSLIPVGFGKRDDAVDTSLFVDFSDGAGDGAR